ncbi:MAG: calcium-binding protein [Cyanobacteria bacterium J06633_8]
MSGNLGETKFLVPVNSTINSQPLFAEATGSATFFNYSQNASGSLTSGDLNILINGGVAAAISNADAVFVQNPTFADLFTQTSAVGEDGSFEVTSTSEIKVLANFDISAGQNLSFNFTADLELTAKEIENPDIEYSKAKSKTTFVVIDISNGVNNAKVLDFFGFKGKLVSSNERGRLQSASSDNVNFTTFKEKDINGDNGTDYINGFVTGNYQRNFSSDTRLAIIEMNASEVELLGDTFINNLGNDVIYGTIRNDYLQGTYYRDKIYGSLGNDTIKAYDGDDIIEGGAGNDWLYGGYGRDSIHGGSGDDYIDGGYGLDHIDGGDGYDTISYADRSNSFSLNLGTGVLKFTSTGNKETILNIEKVIASRGNDYIYGNQDSNHLEGNDGNDYIKGVAGNNVLIGGDGSDTVIGGSGEDKIVGTDSYNAGFYERDYLTGGGGVDEFVLGDVNRAYYGAYNHYDYAIIDDFKVGEDKLILHGSASDYYVKTSYGDAFIYYKDYGNYDKVAVLDNVNSNFDLGSNASFV